MSNEVEISRYEIWRSNVMLTCILDAVIILNHLEYEIFKILTTPQDQ